MFSGSLARNVKEIYTISESIEMKLKLQLFWLRLQLKFYRGRQMMVREILDLVERVNTSNLEAFDRITTELKNLRSE